MHSKPLTESPSFSFHNSRSEACHGLPFHRISFDLFWITTARATLSSLRVDFRFGFSAPTPLVRLRPHDVVLIRPCHSFNFHIISQSIVIANLAFDEHS